MPQRSVGCVVIRGGKVLLVHPSGWYNRSRPHSIPKGLAAGEEPEETAALREVREETGLRCRIVADLGCIRQRAGKEVRAFLAEVVEGRILADGTCPDHDWEVDEARFYTLEEAEALIIEAQKPLLERALERLAEGREN